uniref:Uncharacterized protein n=1 Tax=Haptolina ericina TaxID=156174 RepID=A0A7S3B6P5_9EUKA
MRATTRAIVALGERCLLFNARCHPSRGDQLNGQKRFRWVAHVDEQVGMVLHWIPRIAEVISAKSLSRGDEKAPLPQGAKDTRVRKPTWLLFLKLLCREWRQILLSESGIRHRDRPKPLKRPIQVRHT